MNKAVRVDKSGEFTTTRDKNEDGAPGCLILNENQRTSGDADADVDLSTAKAREEPETARITELPDASAEEARGKSDITPREKLFE